MATPAVAWFEVTGKDGASPVERGGPMTAPGRNVVVPRADDASIGLELPEITDDYMRSRLRHAQHYTLIILKKTPKYSPPTTDPMVWEHGRRNIALQLSGLMPIVCPIRDDSDLAGIGIFTVSPERAAEIVSGDPAVKAGIFAFEVHPVAGFPGSRLPERGQLAGES